MFLHHNFQIELESILADVKQMKPAYRLYI
jgi:hypothetical protein